MDNSLENLDLLLKESTEKLDAAAKMIKDLEIDRSQNIRKIGESLVNIFEIQLQIYEIRPDLKPDHLE